MFSSFFNTVAKKTYDWVSGNNQADVEDEVKVSNKIPAVATTSNTVDGKYVFINIDLQRTSKAFFDYKTKLSASEKIQLLKQEIKNAYDKALMLEPNAKEFIITAREYLITDDSDSKSVSNATKDEMISVLMDLVKENDKLTIITPPTSVRTLKQGKDASKLLSYYGRINSIKEAEENSDIFFPGTERKDIANNERHALAKSRGGNEFTKVSVRSYVLEKETQKVNNKYKPSSYVKQTPFAEEEPYSLSHSSEVLKKSAPLDAVYSPGKKSRMPLVLASGLTIDLRICRELEFMAPFKENQCHVHLILADSVDLDFTKVGQQPTLYFDSANPSSHLVVKPGHEDDTTLEIVSYNYTMLEADKKLNKIEVYHPLALAYSELVDRYSSRFIEKSTEHNNFLKIKQNLAVPIALDRWTNSSNYKLLINMMSYYQGDDKLCPNSKEFLLGVYRLMIDDLSMYPDLRAALSLKQLLMTTSSKEYLEECIVSLLIDQDTIASMKTLTSLLKMIEYHSDAEEICRNIYNIEMVELPAEIKDELYRISKGGKTLSL